MTNEQLYFAVGVPLVVNIALFTVQAIYINGRFGSIERKLELIEQDLKSLFKLFSELDKRLTLIEEK